MQRAGAQVLTAITVWCHHNGPEAFLDLLPAVRLERMSVHELQIMSQHAMILQHPPALDRVHAALATAKPLGNPPGNPRQAPMSAPLHSCRSCINVYLGTLREPP